MLYIIYIVIKDQSPFPISFCFFLQCNFLPRACVYVCNVSRRAFRSRSDHIFCNPIFSHQKHTVNSRSYFFNIPSHLKYNISPKFIFDTLQQILKISHNLQNSTINARSQHHRYIISYCKI